MVKTFNPVILDVTFLPQRSEIYTNYGTISDKPMLKTVKSPIHCGTNNESKNISNNFHDSSH